MTLHPAKRHIPPTQPPKETTGKRLTQVVGQLVVGGDDDAAAAGVELGPPRAAEDLLDVQNAQVGKRAALGVVDLRGFGGFEGLGFGVWGLGDRGCGFGVSGGLKVWGWG
jgi:hypothetical protein